MRRLERWRKYATGVCNMSSMTKMRQTEQGVEYGVFNVCSGFLCCCSMFVECCNRWEMEYPLSERNGIRPTNSSAPESLAKGFPGAQKVAKLFASSMLAHHSTVFFPAMQPLSLHSLATPLRTPQSSAADPTQAYRLSFGEVLPAKEEPQGQTPHRTPPVLREGQERTMRDEDSRRACANLHDENWRSELRLSFPGNGALVDARAANVRVHDSSPTKTPCFSSCTWLKNRIIRSEHS